MTSADQTPCECPELKVQLNRRSFRRNLLLMVPIFLANLALAIFASGAFHFFGIGGAIAAGFTGLYAGIAGTRQIRSRLVIATLNEFGVSFDRHDPAAWETFREVRVGLIKPRLLFVLRPLHYIAFVPDRVCDLPRRTARERLAIRMYGTSMLLMAETVLPAGAEILAAVERLSDVPVIR